RSGPRQSGPYCAAAQPRLALRARERTGEAYALQHNRRSGQNLTPPALRHSGLPERGMLTLTEGWDDTLRPDAVDQRKIVGRARHPRPGTHGAAACPPPRAPRPRGRTGGGKGAGGGGSPPPPRAPPPRHTRIAGSAVRHHRALRLRRSIELTGIPDQPLKARN